MKPTSHASATILAILSQALLAACSSPPSEPAGEADYQGAGLTIDSGVTKIDSGVFQPITAADDDGDGVPNDKDRCNDPVRDARSIKGSNTKAAVGEDGCPRRVAPKTCHGDDEPPTFATGPAEEEAGPWYAAVEVRRAGAEPVLTITGAATVRDNCPTVFATLSGTIRVGAKSVPFVCQSPDPIVRQGVTQFFWSRVAGYYRGQSPCTFPLSPMGISVAEWDAAGINKSIEIRVDAYDANKNHLAVGFGRRTLRDGTYHQALKRDGFNRPAAWTDRALPPCPAQSIVASGAAVVTGPAVVSGTTLPKGARFRIEQAVAKGAACAGATTLDEPYVRTLTIGGVNVVDDGSRPRCRVENIAGDATRQKYVCEVFLPNPLVPSSARVAGSIVASRSAGGAIGAVSLAFSR